MYFVCFHMFVKSVVSHCCPVGELWWTGCSLKRLIIAHHGIVFWLQGQPLGREHTHTHGSCHTAGVWWFLHSQALRVCSDPWVRQDSRLFERSVEDECSETGLRLMTTAFPRPSAHFYLYSLHPREQMTPAHVSESKICVYNSPSELFK